MKRSVNFHQQICKDQNSFGNFVIHFLLYWPSLLWGLSLVAAGRITSSLRRLGFSLHWLTLLQNMGSEVLALQYLRPAGSSRNPQPLGHGSVAVVHRLSCCVACGIFQGQALISWLLRWQVDSLLLNHQGCPGLRFLKKSIGEEWKETLSTFFLGVEIGTIRLKAIIDLPQYLSKKHPCLPEIPFLRT